MIKTISLALAGLLFMPAAFAQDCSGAIEVFSDNAGDHYAPPGSTTCGHKPTFIELPGGIAIPQPDVLYKFTAQDANATITLNTTGSTLIPGIVVLDACSDTSASIVARKTGNAGDILSMPVSGLQNGRTYYMLVTSKPGSPDDNCGPFSGTIDGTLPVSVQSFSVE